MATFSRQPIVLEASLMSHSSSDDRILSTEVLRNRIPWNMNDAAIVKILFFIPFSTKLDISSAK
ncbi:hypothetical protein BLA29_013884 [Euroglyphus maynei]|uniref:Uncharacterized protein n=1 Tax=Euroglyphus maynei TaxID=6958 RepID=A0A1Y3BES0_EURMA|nr:hypothetical protein BLA29_013884 [Euroglyphus maynei]